MATDWGCACVFMHIPANDMIDARVTQMPFVIVQYIKGEKRDVTETEHVPAMLNKYERRKKSTVVERLNLWISG